MVVALLVCAAQAGCKGSPDNGKKGDLEKHRVRADAKTMSDEDRLLSLASCKVEVKGIASKCPAWKAFRSTEHTRDPVRIRSRAEIGLRHLANPSGAVRIRAFVWATRADGVAPANRADIIAAIKREKNPGVLSVMINHASVAIHGDDTGALWISMAEHSSVEVRRRVAIALTDRRMVGTKGTLEKAMSMIENDSSPLVRGAGCARLGERQDERALPLLQRMTAGAKSDPKLYQSCFFGLVGMWLSTSSRTTEPSKKAYDLTLKRLRAKPRNALVPPRAVVRRLRHAARPMFTKKKPAWYKASDLVAVLLEIAADRNARPITRGAAIASMHALGASRAQIESLRSAISDEPDERLVKDAFTETLGKMGKK